MKSTAKLHIGFVRVLAATANGCAQEAAKSRKMCLCLKIKNPNWHVMFSHAPLQRHEKKKGSKSRWHQMDSNGWKKWEDLRPRFSHTRGRQSPHPPPFASQSSMSWQYQGQLAMPRRAAGRHKKHQKTCLFAAIWSQLSSKISSKHAGTPEFEKYIII